MRYGANLRALLDHDEIIVCPGAHDSLTARALDRVGFDAMYMTGYGTSLSRAGVPDAGLITMPEMIANAGTIQEVVDVPVIADADNGFGNATNVIRTVREYIKTGVAAIHIEDQSFPKRCGHTKGRQVVPREEAVGKYRAAAAVRDERDEEFILIARTDARGAVGGSLDEAIDRVNTYCEAGADIAFVEGPTDEDEVERIGREVDAPLLYNCTGISPRLDPEEFHAYGFDIVIYPGLSMRSTISAVYEHATTLKKRGTAGLEILEEEFDTLPFGFHEFAGFPEVVGWEEQFLPEEELGKYDETLGADVRNESE